MEKNNDENLEKTSIKVYDVDIDDIEKMRVQVREMEKNEMTKDSIHGLRDYLKKHL